MDTPSIPFPSIPIAGILFRVDGTIVAVNPSAWRIIGERPLIGRPVAELDPSTGARWADLIARVRADGQAVDETLFQSPVGPRHLQFALSFVEHGGERLVQAYALDVTPIKLAEHARAETEARLAAERLESLGLVAGGIAHDFNNLLVGVLAESSAAQEDPALGEGGREALRRIEAAARRMAQLTRQLLAYAGRGQVAIAPVAPDELLAELREALGQLAGGRLALEPGASGAVIEADPSLLRQVVLNLVGNAVDAGGARIAVTSRVVARDGAPCWQLEVTDDGAGIAPDALARIFEPFYSTKPGHHGLGLSAVFGIVRRLGGDLEVDSTPGRGARFRVRLPVALGAEPRRPNTTDAIPALAKLTGVRVLVADDEPSVRATVRRLLERRGASVVVACDGVEAEARLRAETFQLVVSDVAMPGRTGYDVLATARATQRGARVVLMSGYTEKLRGEGGEDEPDGFLEKPFAARTLDAMIDRVLRA